MNSKGLGSVEAIGMLLTISIAHLIIYLPEKIISDIGSASIINIFYITAIIFILTLIVVKLFKNFNTWDILDIAEFLGGSFFKKIVSFLTVCYSIFFAGLFVRDFAESLKILYFDDFKIYTIILFFLTGAFFINRYEFRKVVRCNSIILPTIVISLIVVVISSIPKFTYQRVFPVFGYGIDKTFLLGLTNISAFSDFIILYYLIPLLKNKKSYCKVSFISMGLTGLLLVSSIGSLLLVHNFSGVQSVFSIYLATRSISFGSFVQRPDSLFILIWILSMFSYLAIIMSLSCHIIDKGRNKANPTKICLIVITVLIFIVSILPQNLTQLRFLENNVLRYLAIGIVFIIHLLILICGNIKLKLKGR